MTVTYRYYSVEVISGRVLASMPLTGVGADRSLRLGSLSATLELAALVVPGDDDATRTAQRDAIAGTDPMRCSVVITRQVDGGPQVPLGEWLIIGQQIEGGRLKLAGRELGHLLDFNPLPAAGIKWLGVDQLVIAKAMVSLGFSTGLPGAVAIDLPAAPSSGVLRDRDYEPGDGASILQRLNELGDVIDGFDWWIDTAWGPTVDGRRSVRRTLRFGYPQAGIQQPYRLIWSSPGMPEKAVLSASFDRDGARLASEVTAFGSGSGSDKVIARRSSPALTDAGYPRLTRTRAYGSVSEPDTLGTHADALLRLSASDEIPSKVSIRADGNPALGEWGLGDRMVLQIDPRPESPDGKTTPVRVIGWTIPDPTAPGPERTDLTLTAATNLPGSET